MTWYTIQTTPNYENKVMEEIEKRKTSRSLEQIRELFSPEETILSYRNGQKKERKKKLYSNYIFIEMDYSEDVWHAFKGIKGFVGFVGTKQQPTIVPDREIQIIRDKINNNDVKHKVDFPLESKVRITGGSFAEFYGIIKGVDYEKNKAKVAVNIFNRETIVDIELNILVLEK